MRNGNGTKNKSFKKGEIKNRLKWNGARRAANRERLIATYRLLTYHLSLVLLMSAMPHLVIDVGNLLHNHANWIGIF